MSKTFYRCPKGKAAKCEYAADGKWRRKDGFRCPLAKNGDPNVPAHCEHDLDEKEVSYSRTIAAIVAGACVIALLAWWLWPRTPLPKQPDPPPVVVKQPQPPDPHPIKNPDPTQDPVKPPVPPPEIPKTSVVLRIHAQDTLAGDLIAPLVAAYLEAEGLTNVTTVPGDDGKSLLIKGNPAGQKDFRAIVVEKAGKDVDFECLLQTGTDRPEMIISSCKPMVTELKNLAPLGRFDTDSCKQVIALDGYAALVHPSNPLKAITTQQVREILLGKITNWSQVGGAAAPVSLHLPTEDSGAFHELERSAGISLGSTGNAHTHAFLKDLSVELGSDVNGFALAPMRFQGVNRIVPVGDAELSERRLPTPFTVFLGDYRLSQRLYVFKAEAPANREVNQLAAFLKLPAASKVIADKGFVNLDIKPLRIELPAALLEGIPKETRERIVTSYRYATIHYGTKETALDELTLPIFRSIVNQLGGMAMGNKGLLLFGFTDNVPVDGGNPKLSQNRADNMMAMCEERGLPVLHAIGRGDLRPVASNVSDDGRALNRRVEIWLVELKH